MAYETEITERLTEAIRDAVKAEMDFGWSFGQIKPMLFTAIMEVAEEMEAKNGNRNPHS